MKKIGRFSRVLRKDGTLLFKSFFRDSAFLISIKHLFHAEYGTEFLIERIVKCSKGFHVKFSTDSGKHF